MHHKQTDVDLNLRSFIFIDVLLTAENDTNLCSYVATYVAKISQDRTERGEPEMAFAFSNKKMSYCNLTCFRLVPPALDYVSKSKVVNLYMERDSSEDHQTLLDYCRSHTMSLVKPKLTDKRNLVGVSQLETTSPQFLLSIELRWNTPTCSRQPDVNVPTTLYSSPSDDEMLKPALVKGKPGTGKTVVMEQVMQNAKCKRYN